VVNGTGSNEPGKTVSWDNTGETKAQNTNALKLTLFIIRRMTFLLR
jgi:hypothetical protein